MTTDPTARPASAPAPVAVPEASELIEHARNLMQVGRRWADRMGDPRNADHGEVRLDIEDFETLSYNLVQAYKPLIEALERLDAAPHPEPVVAPLPSEGVDVVLATFIDGDRDVMVCRRGMWFRIDQEDSVPIEIVASWVRLVPEDDEVLVDGSWFKRADLPTILANHMRAADEAAREAKDLHRKNQELLEAVRTPMPASAEDDEDTVRERIAAALTEQALMRFDEHGPHDQRGAAFWDAAQGIRDTGLGR